MYRKSISPPTRERLLQLLRYDPISGDFVWLEATTVRVKVGDVAGWYNKDGYRLIGIDGEMCNASRLAWLYMTGEWPSGPDKIDHKNGNRSDDRWCNLRKCTTAQNIANAKRSRINTSGFKGVSFDKRKQRWRADISKQRKFLGFHDTPEQAHAAYCAAATEIYGEFARFE